MTDYNERYSYEIFQGYAIIKDNNNITEYSLPLQMLNQIVKKDKALQKVRTV